MRAWAVKTPGPIDNHPLVLVERETPVPGPGQMRLRVVTCGACPYCLTGRENLCLKPVFTGWDIDGGYATFVIVNEDFVYRLPEGYDDVAVAPLLCAGIIGYRALRRTELPTGGRLGIYGFGGSAHLTSQIAIAEG